MLNLNQKEKILYRISRNVLYYKVGKKRLEIRYPTQKIRYNACEIYDKIYDKSVNKYGLIKEAELKQFLYPNGLFTKEDDDILEIAPKHIEYFKKQLYLNNGSSNQVQQLRQYLKVAKNSFLDTITKLHSYDYITAEGVANFAKWQFIVQYSTFYRGKKWDWSSGSIYAALNFYYENIIDDDTIREISHTPPFDVIWGTGRPFNKTGIDLTLDQQKLIGWAKLYDNIQDSSEPPPKRVIEDDDFLDGWLIIQREKREQQDIETVAKNLLTNPKIANSDEVYIMPKLMNPKEVQSLNSPFAKNIIKQRISQINRAGGELKEQQLQDVQQKLSIQQVQAERGRYA